MSNIDFVKAFTQIGVNKAERERLLNKSLYVREIHRIVSDYQSNPKLTVELLKDIFHMQLDKGTPDPEIVALCAKHLNPMLDRMTLEKSLNPTVAIEFTELELALVEKALSEFQRKM